MALRFFSAFPTLRLRHLSDHIGQSNFAENLTLLELFHIAVCSFLLSVYLHFPFYQSMAMIEDKAQCLCLM